MRLIHVRFQTPADFRAPADLSAQFLAQVTPTERIDHVSIHPGGDCCLTVGMFVVADSVHTAEDAALTVARRALTCVPALRCTRITSCAAALVAPYFEALLNAPGHGGRSMRLPDQDTEES